VLVQQQVVPVRHRSLQVTNEAPARESAAVQSKIELLHPLATVRRHCYAMCSVQIKSQGCHTVLSRCNHTAPPSTIARGRGKRWTNANGTNRIFLHCLPRLRLRVRLALTGFYETIESYSLWTGDMAVLERGSAIRLPASMPLPPSLRTITKLYVGILKTVRPLLDDSIIFPSI
jgi:hypothetical protein